MSTLFSSLCFFFRLSFLSVSLSSLALLLRNLLFLIETLLLICSLELFVFLFKIINDLMAFLHLSSQSLF